MSPKRRWHAAALVLWAGLGGSVFSQDSPIPATSPVLGKVLVLDSERCLEGEVELSGEQYCVRQGASEVWLSAKKVLRVCPDWKSAFEFVKQRANLDDPDERLRLARWCQLQNRLTEALAEAKAAQELRPTHTETQLLVRVLKDSVKNSKEPAAPAPITPVDATPMPDLSPEAIAHFTTTIQPILFNTCVSCHNPGKAGEFVLYRTSDGGSRASMQRNLKAVLQQVRFDRLELSPLLIKACSPHGASVKPPLAGKKSAPFQTLERWVSTVITTHPHLKQEALARLAAEGKRPALPEGPTHFASGETTAPPTKEIRVAEKSNPEKSKVNGAATPPLPGLPAGEPVEKIIGVTRKKAPAKGGALPVAAPLPVDRGSVRDPYGPGEFNRVMHPGRREGADESAPAGPKD